MGPWLTRFWVDGTPCGGSSYDPSDDGRIKLFKTQIGSLEGKRILELGPLEGGHTLQLVKRGATVVGVEGREESIQRCLFVKKDFNLEKAEFVHGDLRAFDLTSLGRFDIIFNIGLLYHLDEPWKLLKRLRHVSSRMFLWTHCAPIEKADTLIHVDGQTLVGMWSQEGPLELPLSGLQPKSFWPTRVCLKRMLALSGWPVQRWLDYNAEAPDEPAATLWVESGDARKSAS